MTTGPQTTAPLAGTRPGPSLRIVRLAAFALLLAGFLPGCLWTPEFSQIVAEINRQVPDARFEKELQLNLGPIAISLARTVLGLVPDEETAVAKGYLDEIRRFKLGIYKVHNLRSARGIRLPQGIRHRLERRNWETVVKLRENDELVIAIYRKPRESITDLFILSINRSELVLVQVAGRLDNLYRKVIEQNVDIGDMLLSGDHATTPKADRHTVNRR